MDGKVTDATGAVIVGAVVTAVNGDADSRLRREATTTADGTFVMERLPAGTYSVTAHIDGFTPSRPEVVTLTAGARQTLAIELQVAPLSEGVTTVYGAKTGRSLLDTPASVGVIDAARMDASAMFRIEDVFRQMANVNRADWVDSGIVLRGINSEGVGGPSGSPLATTYIDGVPQTQNGTRRGVNGTWDLQQVEVWRGPQSTIVGRNALAGAIQVKSNDPTMRWESAARIGVGADTFNNQAAMVSGPIVDDKLAFRVAVEQQSRHGDVRIRCIPACRRSSSARMTTTGWCAARFCIAPPATPGRTSSPPSHRRTTRHRWATWTARAPASASKIVCGDCRPIRSSSRRARRATTSEASTRASRCRISGRCDR